MAFASGKSAYGISDRSGFRYRLRDMKKEWTGALVGPDELSRSIRSSTRLDIARPAGLARPSPGPGSWACLCAGGQHGVSAGRSY
jgi:hypothetical protein